MTTIFARLYYEFFKVGLFSIGGGLATLPFLAEIGEKTGWFTQLDLANMVAISEATPGPLGINMATYVGFTSAGPLGAFLAPIGLTTPAIVVIILVTKMLNRFKESPLVQGAFYGLRPASMALIVSAGITVASPALLRVSTYMQTGSLADLFFWKGIVLAAVLFVAMRKLNWHPIIFIIVSAIVGVVFQF